MNVDKYLKEVIYLFFIVWRCSGTKGWLDWVKTGSLTKIPVLSEDVQYSAKFVMYLGQEKTKLMTYISWDETKIMRYLGWEDTKLMRYLGWD